MSALRETTVTLAEETPEADGTGLVRVDRAWHRLAAESSIFIDGTSFDDVFTVSWTDPDRHDLGLTVDINGESTRLVPRSVQRLVIYGWSGDDTLQLLDPVSVPIFFEAGAGEDLLDLSPIAEQTTVVFDPNFDVPNGRMGGMFRDLEIIRTGSGDDVILAPSELDTIAGPQQQPRSVEVQAGDGFNRLDIIVLGATSNLSATSPSSEQIRFENINEVSRPLFMSAPFSSVTTASYTTSSDARARLGASSGMNQSPSMDNDFLPLSDIV